MLTSSAAWLVYALSAALLITTAVTYPVVRRAAIKAQRAQIAIESEALGYSIADE